MKFFSSLTKLTFFFVPEQLQESSLQLSFGEVWFHIEPNPWTKDSLVVGALDWHSKKGIEELNKDGYTAELLCFHLQFDKNGKLTHSQNFSKEPELDLTKINSAD